MTHAKIPPASLPAPGLSNWLFFCAFMIVAMAIIGAITRLTESGLSITEWNPVMGAIPPLTHKEWEHAFALYQKTPEFIDKHYWMKLHDFKQIFFWEWFHRLWGRTIGLVYALPLLWFWLRKKIPAGFGWKLVLLLGLGGLQGFVGWFMVESGLVHRPSVSHFRLATHLALALFLYAAMLWVALDLRRTPGATQVSKNARWGWALLGLLATTIVWGAFTAGLKAGYIYNTFPLMGDGLIPPDFGNPLISPAGVQCVHRFLAISTLVAVLAFAWRTRGENKVAPWMAAMVIAQVGLGISTLLSHVEIHLAVTHQAGAIILLGLCVTAQNLLSHRKNKAL